MSEQVPLSEAARRLGLDYQQVRARLLRGEIKGGRDPFGRYFVEALEIERLLRQPAA